MAGRGAHGVGGRRRAAPMRGRLRDGHLDAPFLRAGGRPVRPQPPPRRAGQRLPADVPVLLAHASALERQRDHVLGKPASTEDWFPEQDLLDEANRTRSTADLLTGEPEALGGHGCFRPRAVRGAGVRDAVGAGQPGRAGVPGPAWTLDADQVAERAGRSAAPPGGAPGRRERVPQEVSLHRALEARRKELNSLVAQVARVRGVPHSHVHAGLRREAGGPAAGPGHDPAGGGTHRAGPSLASGVGRRRPRAAPGAADHSSTIPRPTRRSASRAGGTVHRIVPGGPGRPGLR